MSNCNHVSNAERVREWRANNPGKHAANQRAYRKRQRKVIAEYEAEIDRLKAKVNRLLKRLRAK